MSIRNIAFRDKRLLVFVLVIAALTLGALGVHGQEPITLNVYSSGDTNITDWLSNIVAPAFEAEYPEYHVNVVIVREGVSVADIALRTLAALQSNSDPQVDFFEGFDPLEFPQETLDANLWVDFSEENVPNVANLNQIANTLSYGLPYRGSQVLIAYDSTRVAEEDVPTTFAELVDWIKANPGQFVYSRPDKGGSGGNFVVRAIYEANGLDPSLFTIDNYSDELAAKYLNPAWDLLNEIHPYIYENGSYPAGNVPVLQLLANGSVSMISAWSDMAVQALNLGTLPDTVKLLQFQDLPMAGGYVYAAIPKNATHMEGALLFANYYISVENQVSVVRDIGGFPGIRWDLLPEDMQAEFTSVISDKVPPVWPGGDWSAALAKGWYEHVATNIDPAS